MAKKKLTKKTARRYGTYALAGQILFGRPFNQMSAVRAFFESFKYLDDE